MADVGGGFRTDETKALGKAKEELDAGEVRVVGGGGEVAAAVQVCQFDERAADDVHKFQRAQLGSERRQFGVDELADAVEG